MSSGEPDYSEEPVEETDSSFWIEDIGLLRGSNREEYIRTTLQNLSEGQKRRWIENTIQHLDQLREWRYSVEGSQSIGLIISALIGAACWIVLGLGYSISLLEVSPEIVITTDIILVGIGLLSTIRATVSAAVIGQLALRNAFISADGLWE